MNCIANQSIEEVQRMTCEQRGVAFVPACDLVNSGFALTTKGNLPINGLRHPATDDTTGWYLWCGETYSGERDFFQPVHTMHLYEQLPEVTRLLGLPPGYRFLVAGDYVDIWFDPSLLEV